MLIDQGLTCVQSTLTPAARFEARSYRLLVKAHLTGESIPHRINRCS